MGKKNNGEEAGPSSALEAIVKSSAFTVTEMKSHTRE